MTAAPKGRYRALLEQGARWDLNGVTVEVESVRKIGKAQVIDLDWDGDLEGMPRQVVMTKKGIRFYEFPEEDNRRLKKLIASKPHFADPPVLDEKLKNRHAFIADDMLCLAYTYGRDGKGEMCGTPSCWWRLCLGADGIAGAGGGWEGPITYTAATTPPGRYDDVYYTASSELPDWKGYKFGSSQLGDHRPGTSWQPAKGKTVGEWAEIHLDDRYGNPPVISLDAIEIANGFQSKDKLGDLFANNARVRTATISLDGKPAVIVDFAEEQRGYVRIDIGGKVAKSVRFTIDAIWPGKKWKEVAISELYLIARPSKE
jgi:hypothetical protein